jgi:hypothetical protein
MIALKKQIQFRERVDNLAPLDKVAEVDCLVKLEADLDLEVTLEPEGIPDWVLDDNGLCKDMSRNEPKRYHQYLFLDRQAFR